MAESKPLLRGYFHLAAVFVAAIASFNLVSKAKSPQAFYSCLVYGFSLTLLFASSALYHRPQWSIKMYQIMRRVDHSAIFILIAGTATPISILAVNPNHGRTLLVIFWAMAFVGILQATIWTHGPKWSRALFYVLMGWMALPYFSEIKVAVGSDGTRLLFFGGLIYTVGALIYAFKWPNPYPKAFGYHEIFHILVIIAAALHYCLIYHLVI